MVCDRSRMWVGREGQLEAKRVGRAQELVPCDGIS